MTVKNEQFQQFSSNYVRIKQQKQTIATTFPAPIATTSVFDTISTTVRRENEPWKWRCWSCWHARLWRWRQPGQPASWCKTRRAEPCAPCWGTTVHTEHRWAYVVWIWTIKRRIYQYVHLSKLLLVYVGWYIYVCTWRKRAKLFPCEISMLQSRYYVHVLPYKAYTSSLFYMNAISPSGGAQAGTGARARLWWHHVRLHSADVRRLGATRRLLHRSHLPQRWACRGHVEQQARLSRNT